MKITKEEAMDKTIAMIARVRGLNNDQVKSGSSLRDELGFDDNSIELLERPIENDDFKSYECKVAPSRLKSRKTPSGIRGVVWGGIKEKYRKYD